MAKTDPSPHEARRLPRFLAEVRSRVRRGRSLRWRANRALRDLGGGTPIRTGLAHLRRMAWSALGTPVVPVLTAVVIAMLHVWGLERAPLAIFFDENASRDALGLLWQVEAAAIALVVAASLFAFESLTRQRETIPLVEYANRSGLAQFLMLAASGLVVVPVVLFATPDRPSPTAAAGAALVGVLGLVALPFFLRRAMRAWCMRHGWQRSA